MKHLSIYRFRKAPDRKTLMYLESFEEKYDPLHVAKKRTGRVYLYLTEKPFHIRAERERKPAFSISNDIYKHLSGIYMPDLQVSAYHGYGDIKGTQDGLLFEFSLDFKKLNIFVLKGQKSIIEQWYWLFAEGRVCESLEFCR